MTDLIQVKLGAGVDQLFAVDGVPVWPAATPSALAAIEQAAELAGLRTQLVSAAVADEPQGTGLVVGVGQGVAAVARLYAHLTERRVSYADDVEAGLARDPAVLVVMERELTVAALDLLSRRAADGQVTGVITGHDADSLLLQALIRSVATRATAQAPTSRIGMFPMLERPPHAEPADGIVDPRTDGAAVRAALGRGAGVLTIMSHSDGIDAGLGSLVLCPMDRAPTAPDLQRLPRCRERGICHRDGGMAIEQWLAGPKHVAPEAIAARVFLYATCWGVLPAMSFNDSAWGLGRRLLSNPRIGALVTSWEAQWYDPVDVLAFARTMAAGDEIGVAVHRLLTTASSQKIGLRMCLFGDPSIRQRSGNGTLVEARSSEGSSVLQSEAGEPSPVAPVRAAKLDGQATAELGFLRHYISLMAPAVTDRALVDEALAATARYELAAVRGLVSVDERAAGEGWRDRVLDALMWRGPLAVRTWLPLSSGIRTSATTMDCPHCRQRVIVREFLLRISEAPMRRVATCAHCGVIADSASPRSTMLVIRDGVIHLTTDVPHARWSARLAIYVRDESGARLSCEWPAAPDGWPARSIAMPIVDNISSDTLDVAVYLIHGVSLHIARAPVRNRVSALDINARTSAVRPDEPHEVFSTEAGVE